MKSPEGFQIYTVEFYFWNSISGILNREFYFRRSDPDRIQIGSRSDLILGLHDNTYFFLTPSQCMRPLYAAALVSLAVTLLVLWYAKIHVERAIQEKRDALKKDTWLGWMAL